MSKFYKIGFYSLLALVLMASATLPSLIEVKPSTPKYTVVFNDHQGGIKIKQYAKEGYVVKSVTYIDRIGATVLVVMEKY